VSKAYLDKDCGELSNCLYQFATITTHHPVIIPLKPFRRSPRQGITFEGQIDQRSSLAQAIYSKPSHHPPQTPPPLAAAGHHF